MRHLLQDLPMTAGWLYLDRTDRTLTGRRPVSPLKQRMNDFMTGERLFSLSPSEIMKVLSLISDDDLDGTVDCLL